MGQTQRRKTATANARAVALLLLGKRGEDGRRTESQMLLCVCCVPHKKLHEGDLRREQNGWDWFGGLDREEC